MEHLVIYRGWGKCSLPIYMYVCAPQKIILDTLHGSQKPSNLNLKAKKLVHVPAIIIKATIQRAKGQLIKNPLN